YVRSLVESLERRHLDLSGMEFSGLNEATLRALRTALGGDPGTILHAVTLVRQLSQAADFTPELRQLLQHPDAAVRAATLEQLGALGTTEPLPQMRALMRDPVPEVRAPELILAIVEQFQRRETALEAAGALAAYGPGIEGALQGILVDEASQVDCRRGVALVLQRLATREAADALVAALTAREPAVRK